MTWLIHVCVNVYIKQLPFFLTGVPVVSVIYSAVWNFSEIQPSNCNNISIRLDNLKEELEEKFANRCQDIYINATVQFRYSFLSFKGYIDTFETIHFLRLIKSLASNVMSCLNYYVIITHIVQSNTS